MSKTLKPFPFFLSMETIAFILMGVLDVIGIVVLILVFLRDSSFKKKTIEWDERLNNTLTELETLKNSLTQELEALKNDVEERIKGIEEKQQRFETIVEEKVNGIKDVIVADIETKKSELEDKIDKNRVELESKIVEKEKALRDFLDEKFNILKLVLEKILEYLSVKLSEKILNLIKYENEMYLGSIRTLAESIINESLDISKELSALLKDFRENVSVSVEKLLKVAERIDDLLEKLLVVDEQTKALHEDVGKLKEDIQSEIIELKKYLEILKSISIELLNQRAMAELSKVEEKVRKLEEEVKGKNRIYLDITPFNKIFVNFKERDFMPLIEEDEEMIELKGDLESI